MITGYYVSRAIHVVAKLGIADLLSQGPRGCDGLSAATETHAPSLQRVMRLLVSVVICTGGRQRSEPEFRFLLGTAGFMLNRIIPTPARISVIEAVPT